MQQFFRCYTGFKQILFATNGLLRNLNLNIKVSVYSATTATTERLAK
jgi:hypothetical protein